MATRSLSRQVAQDSAPAGASVQESGASSQLKLTFALFLVFAFVGFARPEDLWPIIGSLRLTMSFGIAAGLTLTLALLTGRSQLRWSGELALVLALTLWFMAGVPFSTWPGGSFNLLTQTWVRTLLFFVLGTQVLTSVSRIEKLIWIILLSELFASGASLLLPETAARLGDPERMSGINKGLLGWNFLGITVSVTTPFIAYLYVSRRSLFRSLLLAAVIGCTMWMLVLTGSRGGMIGVILSILLSWGLILRGSPRGMLITVLMGLALIVGVIKAPPVFWERMATIWDSKAALSNDAAASAEESTEGRQILLQESIQETLEYPIFGLGVGNFGVYNGNRGTKTGWYGTHNTFTQVSSESGIPGLLLVVTLLVVMIRHMKKVASAIANPTAERNLQLLARATLISTVSFIFSGFFAHIAYDYLLYFVAAISAAIWTLNRDQGETTLSEPPTNLGPRFVRPVKVPR